MNSIICREMALNLCTFYSRPPHNSIVKKSSPAYLGELPPKRLLFKFFFGGN